MVWAALATGWVLGCVSLYSYMILTAQEPDREECMDCNLGECTACPCVSQQQDADLRRAA